MSPTVAQRSRRIALVSLLAALVVLAGCTGGGNGGDTTTAPDGTTGVPEPTTDQGPGPGVTTATTAEAPRTTAPGTTTPPPSDNVSIVSGHIQQLEAAGSFTSTIQIHFESVQGRNVSTLDVRRRASVDVDGAAFVNQTTRVRTVERNGTTTRRFNASSVDLTYTAGGETFRQTSSTLLSSDRYGYGTAPYNNSEPSPVNTTTEDGSQLFSERRIDWKEQGTTTVDGETMTKYTAEGADSIPTLNQWVGASFETIDSVNATLLVSDSGVVRRMSMQVSGTTSNGVDSTLSIRFSVSALGTTTVEAPGWLETARQRG